VLASEGNLGRSIERQTHSYSFFSILFRERERERERDVYPKTFEINCQTYWYLYLWSSVRQMYDMSVCHPGRHDRPVQSNTHTHTHTCRDIVLRYTCNRCGRAFGAAGRIRCARRCAATASRRRGAAAAARTAAALRHWYSQIYDREREREREERCMSLRIRTNTECLRFWRALDGLPQNLMNGFDAFQATRRDSTLRKEKNRFCL
jgi:hypothetical protein